MDRLGFKGTDPAMRCRGMQFELGTVHRHPDPLEMCKSGFHFCSRLADVDAYYQFSTSRVFIVQHGAHVLDEGDKCVTNEIVFLREITRETIDDLMTAPEYRKPMSENTNGLFQLFAARGDLEMVRYLLDHGANVHVNDDTALGCASVNGNRDVVELLLDRGADIHAKDSWALRFASVNGHRDVVELLLDRGADIHAQDDCALRWASETGHRDVVVLLLDRGADIHAQDDYALSWARQSGHKDVVELLLKNGAESGAEERC